MSIISSHRFLVLVSVADVEIALDRYLMSSDARGRRLLDFHRLIAIHILLLEFGKRIPLSMPHPVNAACASRVLSCYSTSSSTD